MSKRPLVVSLISLINLCALSPSAWASPNTPCTQAFNNSQVTAAQIKACKQYAAAKIKEHREIANEKGAKIAAALTYHAVHTGNPLPDTTKPRYLQATYKKHCRLEIKSSHPNNRPIQYRVGNQKKVGSTTDAGVTARFNLSDFQMSDYPFVRGAGAHILSAQYPTPYNPYGYSIHGQNDYLPLAKRDSGEPQLWIALGNTLLPDEITGRNPTQLRTLITQRLAVTKTRRDTISREWGLTLYHCDQTKAHIEMFQRAKTMQPGQRTSWP